MSSDDFHGKPFDEGTVCKLHIFELYAREWFPVFLSSEKPRRKAIHVFDFFAGPGTDRNNVLGSPLRLLSQLQDYQGAQGWEKVAIHAHFYDEDSNLVRIVDLWYMRQDPSKLNLRARKIERKEYH